MLWQEPATARLLGVLRFFVSAAMLLQGIAITAGLVYVVSKLVYFSVRYLDSTLFSKPW